MKRLKRMAALLIVLVMVFALAGCGKSDVVGTWQTDMDLVDVIAESVDSEIGDADISYRDYVDSFSIRFYTEFKEDGTYKQTIDEDAFNASIEGLKSATTNFYYDYFTMALAETFSQMGAGDLSTREDVEEYLGMSLDEAIQQSIGMGMEELVDMVLGELTLENLVGDEAVAEGKYKTSGGKLYMSDGLDYNVDPEVYELYEIKDGVMTISEGKGVENEFGYPYVLEKIA